MIHPALPLALHSSIEHGLANPWILIPLGTFAALYYLVLGVAGLVKRGLVRALTAAGAAEASIESTEAPPRRGPLVFAGVRIVDPPACPPGTILEIERVEAGISPLALARKEVPIPRLVLTGVDLRLPLPRGEARPVASDSRFPAFAEDENARTFRVSAIALPEVRVHVAAEGEGDASSSFSRPLALDLPSEALPLRTFVGIILEAMGRTAVNGAEVGAGSDGVGSADGGEGDGGGADRAASLRLPG